MPGAEAAMAAIGESGLPTSKDELIDQLSRIAFEGRISNLQQSMAADQAIRGERVAILNMTKVQNLQGDFKTAANEANDAQRKYEAKKEDKKATKVIIWRKLPSRVDNGTYCIVWRLDQPF